MTLNSKNIVGKNLIRYRKEAKLSQCQLAVNVGTGQKTISKIENGNHNFSIDTLEKLCNGLGIPVYKIFIPDEEMKIK